MRFNIGDSFIQFTEHTKYKLKGMTSLNTSTLANPFCHKMIKNKDLICHRCYARTLESLRSLVAKRFEENGKILSSRLLKNNEIPILNYKYVRLNAFGELLNRTHYLNYMKIVEANDSTIFALWSKRLDILKNKKIFDNLIYVYSSPRLNVIAKDQTNKFDKIFTTFTTKYIRENNIILNCHGKECLSCKLCYTKNNDVKFINEKVRAS